MSGTSKGSGVASAWLRIATIVGAVAVFAFAIETRGRVLEEISP